MFGNNAHDGYTASSYKYQPKWEKLVDFNPDHQPSSSALIIEDRGADILWLLQVKGLGVIVLRAPASLDRHGVAIFTKADIGYAPDL